MSGIRAAGCSTASACNTDTTPTQPHRNAKTHRTKNNTTNVVIQQNSHKILMMDILMSETCWAHKKWNKIASGIKLVFWAFNTDTTPTQPHRNSNTHRTKNNTTNVVFQQNSRKLLMMYILMSEICWAHKKWNKIASDIKLVFYSSNITMMYGPINISSQYIGYRQRRNYSWTLKDAEESGRSLIWVTINDSKLGEPQNIYSVCNRIIQAEFYMLYIVSCTHDTCSGFHAVNCMTKSVQFTRLVWVPLFVYFAFIWR